MVPSDTSGVTVGEVVVDVELVELVELVDVVAGVVVDELSAVSVAAHEDSTKVARTHKARNLEVIQLRRWELVAGSPGLAVAKRAGQSE